MEPLVLALLLIVVGLVLLGGDLLLPSGGILSILGVGALVTAVILFFAVDRWLGLLALFGSVVLSPFIAVVLVRAWQHTPVGKRMILDHNEPRIRGDVVRVGQVGRTLSALRPMGECEFEIGVDQGGGGVTTVVQARSEFGDLPPGVQVRVTHFKDGLATVRPAASKQAATGGLAHGGGSAGGAGASG